jgi:methionyl-tRNA synthetase
LIPNEFYELESAKFSTSRGHIVSVDDLLREVPRDVARLYLALTAPENQRTTFSRAGLAAVTRERLVEPWNRIAATLGTAVAGAGPAGKPLPVSPLGRARAATMVERFDATYELPAYSLTRSADNILVQLERLDRRAARLDGVSLDAEPEAWGDLFLEVQALLAGAAPILIDLGAAAREAGGFTGVLRPGAFDVPEVTPFAPPTLPTDPSGGR